MRLSRVVLAWAAAIALAVAVYAAATALGGVWFAWGMGLAAFVVVFYDRLAHLLGVDP